MRKVIPQWEAARVVIAVAVAVVTATVAAAVTAVMPAAQWLWCETCLTDPDRETGGKKIYTKQSCQCWRHSDTRIA